MDTPNKERELRRNQRRALFFLLASAALFLLTAFLPPGFWVSGAKAVAEAALIGALADWFAVAALFHRIGVPGLGLPIPFLTRHTAIIPNNKARIADELASFVRDKFLDEQSLVQLIRQHDPASRLAAWLRARGNARRLSRHLAKAAAGMLALTGDARIQRLMAEALRALLRRLDLSQAAGSVLETLTKDGRHQQLLDEGMAQLVALLRDAPTRALIAQSLVLWFKREYPTIEKLMPTSWAGRNGAELVASVLDKVLAEVARDPDHALRRKFDQALERLIARLRQDPSFIEQGEKLKRALAEGEAANRYVAALWQDWRQWLERDLAAEDSALRAGIAGMGLWLGRQLARSPALRQSLNEHLEGAARAVAPDFARFLARHISDTVKRWDTRELSRQIELDIGKDLQYIRINGTLVGGLIGMLLYLGSRGIEAVSPYVR
ncbi:DUF445 domain-containing protein [Orrella sp. JC864]|uniref:DUF445 domain-containing protein n=1 Tax=Orrella sp. JC864 TaxID=3120298 RepID=UPI003FA68AE7